MNWTRSRFSILLAPALCTGLLMGAAYAQRAWPERADAEPFHARAAAAVAQIPLRIGPWIGKEKAPQPAVIQVLRPNAIRNIEYVDARTVTFGRPSQQLWLSLVQCKRSGDMLGHYPPNCYPAFGDKLVYQQQRRWFVTPEPTPAGGETGRTVMIPGVEYHFDGVTNGRTYRRIVYNFMVAPRRGILPDMKLLEEAAEEYEQRYSGAAQFQVVFRSLAGQEQSQTDRDQTFQTLMRACGKAIDVLQAGDATQAGDASQTGT